MSYHEKRSIVNIISTILITGSYFWYILQNEPTANMNTDELLKFWATSLLYLIPVSIVAKIVIHIVFAIFNAITTREDVPKKDERDKLIELKSVRNSNYMFGFGFMLAMIAIALNGSVTLMFAILIIGGMCSEIFDNATQLYFYRKGI
jgi:uncharacterized membrane protein